ncbi:MAG: TOMM precursor leader peptide-binding protein [Pseudonocardiaceae bacterium]|nr:TOMM precursor leader peptide-binding protein [Pseudonocardiaceae bacterium]
MDGTRSTASLLAEAVAAGADAAEVRAVLEDLRRAGLVTDGAHPTAGPTARDVDAGAWSVHSTLPADELCHRRGAATVRIDGSTRLMVALATSLAATGVGGVVVDPGGTVQPADIGTGYQLADVGRRRRDATRDALRRAAATVRTVATPRYHPDLVVLADALVPDPEVTQDLVARRLPHLAVHAHEGVAVVGPLVLPGRSSCLRCVQLRRADVDPAWPKLAAQLVDAEPVADLGCIQGAAALAAEQVLAVLAGPSAGLASPPTWDATLELDPLRGQLRRRNWSPHPHCGCGAAGTAAAARPASPAAQDCGPQLSCGSEPIRERIQS